MPCIIVRFVQPIIVLILFCPTGYLQANPPETLAKADDVIILASTGSPAASDQSRASSCELDQTKKALLDRVNKARSQTRQCGDESFEAAEPLTWNCKLEAAAMEHSKDMAKTNYFGHASPEGTRIGDRVSAVGYKWQAVGENIAAGQRSATAVINGWLASPGHCANIMNGTFTEMGLARVDMQSSKYSRYWTQVFARPR
ncbi:CAP domain-containing protein [Phytohalomonas tamaricis]|uniref:CAP domain-containing protein n=1 Tax=Phytohalomonas tamaricis TaxID=2081032 RepID=UPI000D0BB7C2|nr:CAP domain-containing protein [Phytohalomonas tamaricis]